MMSHPLPQSPMEDDLAYNSYRLTQLIREEMIRHLNRLEITITPEQLHLLYCVATQENGMKPTDLALLARRDKTTISRMVETMVRHDFVNKVLLPSDGRSYLICLTRKSRDILNTIQGQALFNTSQVFETLSNAEQELLLALIQKCRRHVHDL